MRDNREITHVQTPKRTHRLAQRYGERMSDKLGMTAAAGAEKKCRKINYHQFILDAFCSQFHTYDTVRHGYILYTDAVGDPMRSDCQPFIVHMPYTLAHNTSE